MKLSPLYIQFLSESLGGLLTKAHFFPLSYVEQAQVLTIALHMAICPEDAERIMERMKDYGTQMYDFVELYVKRVREHNAQGNEQIRQMMDLNRMFEKIRDQTRSRNPN